MQCTELIDANVALHTYVDRVVPEPETHTHSMHVLEHTPREQSEDHGVWPCARLCLLSGSHKFVHSCTVPLAGIGTSLAAWREPWQAWTPVWTSSWRPLIGAVSTGTNDVQMTSSPSVQVDSFVYANKQVRHAVSHRAHACVVDGSWSFTYSASSAGAHARRSPLECEDATLRMFSDSLSDCLHARLRSEKSEQPMVQVTCWRYWSAHGLGIMKKHVVGSNLCYQPNGFQHTWRMPSLFCVAEGAHAVWGGMVRTCVAHPAPTIPSRPQQARLAHSHLVWTKAHAG